MQATQFSSNIDFSVIRQLRKDASMTLENVSEKSGVSIAVLSRLERNQQICEIETLYRLARVFNLSASDLLGLAESTAAHPKRAESYRSGFFEFEKVSYAGIDCFLAEAHAGSELTRPEAHGDEFEICWVLEGRLRISLPAETHELGPGEALQFDAVLPHTYEVLENARLHIIHLKKTHRF